MNYQLKIDTKILLATLLLTAALFSCSKWDDYKKHTETGEIIYSGKLDSVNAYGGYKRVRITGRLNADPKITMIKIFWNTNKDSLAFDAKTSVLNGVFNQTFAMPEGTANFTIHTYDAAGNKSVPVYTSATIYGDQYQGTLSNRLISDAQLQPSGSARIDWADVNVNAGVVAMQIRYVTNTNVNKDTIIGSSSATAFSSLLPNYKAASLLQYRTLYKPTASAIDTFYAAFQNQVVRFDEDVSSKYLGNYKAPFTSIPSPDWRFQTLGAPWVLNAAAKNKGGGTYGGWAAEPWQGPTGYINWETWGNTRVVNGIMYQPTSAPLPAGKYTVEYNYYSEVQQNSSVYCVVAAGGNGIPTLPNLSTALASSAMYNGANVGATGPSANESKSFSFTLTTPQVVSIGFLGNLLNASDPGNYFIVRYIKLISNH